MAPAVTGGVSLVLFGEADLPPGPRKTVYGFVRDGVGGRVPLVAWGDAAFAAQLGADGAHLASAGGIAEARQVLGPERLLGVTVRTPEEAARASEEGADYALILYDWSDPEVALGHLRSVCAAGEIPVIAGLDVPLEHVPACMAAGASGIAICSAGMSSENRTAAAQANVKALSR